jgi:hypothetical protein
MLLYQQILRWKWNLMYMYNYELLKSPIILPFYEFNPLYIFFIRSKNFKQLMFNISSCSDNSELLYSGNFQIPNFLARPTGVKFS